MSKQPQKEPRSDRASEPRREEFEEFVDALLKVDPKGLSGKHRAESKESSDDSGKDTVG